MSLPKGWKYELVGRPSPHVLPASERYRQNFDRIFKKDADGPRLDELDPDVDLPRDSDRVDPCVDAGDVD